MEPTNPKPRVLLKLVKYGAIVFMDFDFLNGDDYVGTKARCDDGSFVEFKARAYPSWAEFLDIEPSAYASFDELRSAVLKGIEDNALDYYWDEVPRFGSRKEILIWLEQRNTRDFIEEWCERIAHLCSEYAAGFALMGVLSPQEIKKLKMREADLAGGPGGGSVPCVCSEASPSELNLTLERKKLPFVFVETQDAQARPHR